MRKAEHKPMSAMHDGRGEVVRKNLYQPQVPSNLHT